MALIWNDYRTSVLLSWKLFIDGRSALSDLNCCLRPTRASDVRAVFMVFEGSIFAGDGRPLGKYEAYRRPLTRSEQDYCRRFLETFERLHPNKENAMATKQKQDNKARSDNGDYRGQDKDKCNMVFLAGPIASRIGIYEDKHAMFLIDCGPERKFVKCTIRDERQLVEKLEAFEKGDYIKLTGFVRIWGKRDDSGEWSDNWEIRITEIKNEAPERQRDFPKQGKNNAITDDDIPF